MLLFHAKSHIGRPCFITPPPPTPTRVCGLFSSKPKLIFLPERRLFVFDFTYDATLSRAASPETWFLNITTLTSETSRCFINQQQDVEICCFIDRKTNARTADFNSLHHDCCSGDGEHREAASREKRICPIIRFDVCWLECVY